jgi:glycosyltransferase involved in cell wall biosynthesis
MESLISIIIPTFNRAHLIGETLDSVIAQTYTNWECIVVDDGSNDYTCELLRFYSKKDSRIQYYQRPKDRPKGANACRNFGFELSKGEYIHWFDSDDLMTRDNLQEKVSYLTNNEQVDFCISKAVKFEGNGRERKFIYSNLNLTVESSLYEDYITGKISILNVTPLWRRKIFESDELYDETLYQYQDLDLYSRIIFKNNRMGIINKELIYIRRFNESISTKNGDFDLKINSFLKVKGRILNRTPNNYVIVEYILKEVLWAMRWNLAKKDYSKAAQCLDLVLAYKSKLSPEVQLKLLRVVRFFKIFKFLKRGETRFKSLLKI